MENNIEKKSGMSNKDFSKLPIKERINQGSLIGEKFIIKKLLEHGVEILPVKGAHADIHLKIDGYLGGVLKDPVQIKLRRTFKEGRNDIAYEVLRNHDNTKKLSDQLKNFHQQGRDYRGNIVEHYFILNQSETEIYYVPANKIKKCVSDCILELNSSKFKGKLYKPFKSTTGIDLRPTKDPDPNSFTPNKVMAFIPVDEVVEEKFSIK
jgi:hypothetical protein